jgi:zinc transport system substrate-binding protein
MILKSVRIVLMFFRATRLVALAASTLLAGTSLAACSGSGSADSGDVQVVAAFYPLQYAADRVAGKHAEVTNLTQPGQEPHDLELDVRSTAKLTDADLVIFEKGLQPAVEETAAQNATGTLLDVADVVKLHAVTAHEYESPHAEEEEHGDVDPHFWQDPLLMAQVGDAIADKLAKIDPAHATDYRANAAALTADLTQLDGEYRSGLTGCARSTVVVSHDAFEYLGKYGLHIEPIAGLSPDAEPAPSDLARLQQLVRKQGITTIFSERLASPKLSQTIAHDTGARTAVLDPLEGLSSETDHDDYLSLMRDNLTSLEKANGC